MNRTAIEWTDYTWNPITGCLHGCPYCYARRLAEGRLKGRFGYENGFEPTFHENRLREPYQVKKPSFIFTVSMGDMFGGWVPVNWVNQILEVVINNPRHIFQVLTKNPRAYKLYDGELPENLWIGTSVDGSGNSSKRIKELASIRHDSVKFVSVEPLLAPLPSDIYLFEGIQWVIIGAQTGPGAKLPEIEWISTITWQSAAFARIPYFIKDNLVKLWKEKTQVYPDNPIRLCNEDSWPPCDKAKATS